MDEISNYELKKADSKKLEEMAKDWPELAMPETDPQFTADFLSRIGIDYQSEKCGRGFIKQYPTDFIVEEITPENRIVDISPSNIELSQDSGAQIGADMIKEGIDTFEAVEMVAEALHVNPANISTAGLKDGRALTAQQIIINGTTPDQVKALQLPKIILKNVRSVKGTIGVGGLWGNKFTILVRVDEKDNAKVDAKIKTIKENGFYNFFSLQRFGPRLINTEIGRLILQGEYEKAVHMLLTAQATSEILALKNIRSKAEEFWGDWEMMRQELRVLPYFFRYEIKLLETLIETGGKYLLGLKAIDSQTKLFVFAYNSYCFNKLLSNYANSGKPIPETLPLISSHSEVLECYKEVLSQEELQSLQLDQEAISFLGMQKRRDIPTVIRPKIHKVMILPTGYIFSFSLAKGAYATTFLTEFFELYTGRPIPDWVDRNRYDIKASLGETPVKETEGKFLKDQTSKSDIVLPEIE